MPRGRAAASALRGLPALLPADPWETVALMDGRFRLAGADVAIADASPFLTPAPSPAFTKALHGFAWLRHLTADMQSAGSEAPSPAARAIAARHYVESWLDLKHRRTPRALAPAVMARRILSWLTAAPLLNGDAGLAMRLRRSMTLQARALELAAPCMPLHADRLLVRIALAAVAVCRGDDRAVTSAAGRLDAELVAQILPDGGHISRNPTVLAELLLDLLPVRDAMLTRGLTPSAALCGAIDRMAPMLGFFRHGDGAFASFGGASPLAPEALAALCAREEASGASVRSAVYSGYHRMEAGQSLLIADAGEMAPRSAAPHAHASALAFEFSDGAQRLVVNCGVPVGAHAAWRDAARSTAAHSTLTLDGDSSASTEDRFALVARFAKAPRIGLGHSRGQTASGERLDMRHGGYLARHGLIHARTLLLSADGGTLTGCDTLLADDDAEGTDAGEAEMALRFHLHPRVTVGRADRGLRLLLPDGTAWTFVVDHPLRVEESICVTPDRGLRPTRQIVIEGQAEAGMRVRWKFARA